MPALLDLMAVYLVRAIGLAGLLWWCIWLWLRVLRQLLLWLGIHRTLLEFAWERRTRRTKR